MRIKIHKEVILQGMQSVIGVISSKNTLPILLNVLVEADKKEVRLTATDLDMGMVLTTPTDVIEEGGVTVPAKRLIDIIKELPDKEVDIYIKRNNVVVIESDGIVFKILGIPKEEFPKLPPIIQKEQLVLEQAVLKKMLNMTSFAISHDETRYVLNGIYFIVRANFIRAVATDGRRLAIFTQPNNTEFKSDTNVIIPAKTIQELLRALKEAGNVRIAFSKNQAMFQIDGLVIISKLIEGEFPNYEQAVPKEPESKLRIGLGQLTAAIKRAGLLVTQESQAIKLQVQKNRLVVSKTTPEIGEIREDIAAEYDGEDLVIGFNPNYLLDALKNIREEKIEIGLPGPEKPAVIRIKDEYIYLVMAMQI